MPLPHSFTEKLHQNWTDGLFLDLQLLCNGQAIGVHKIVLCSHSPVFLTALSGPYQESEEEIYEVNDSSYPIVVGMVTFMYTGSYKAPDENSTVVHKGYAGVLFHAGMVALADKYLIPSLRELALREFRKCVDWETNLRALLQSVSGVYAIEGDGRAELRHILVNRFDSRLAFHIEDHGMEHLLREISEITPQFTIDLAMALLLTTSTARCQSCHETIHTARVRVSAGRIKCKTCGRKT
ncbi:BTB/POZ domain protein [Beauveria bassiana ARSEF 2860]|uniref:BTB/POZ domain protein n=1 Tax=Beauveria bassiana (strain ARSEF 2860) TaxID=655819 RepID=J4UU27_BEAB2|nr:BTB/POZ domain protein [Beauveria bassiana ARSEF 2860]EJP69417.1 BTB/POZ domain protein [Beauveria bassiana ARSEF 2860]